MHGQARAIDRIIKGIVPLVVILAAAGLIALLVAIGFEDDGHEAFWGQLIAGVSLVLATALVYTTGPRKFTVIAAIEGADGEVRYGPGIELTRDQYEALSNEDKRKVRRQRGRYFRALYVGADGRWSTSKVQALAWTYVLLYGLLSLFIANELGLALLQDGIEIDFDQIDLQANYLLLLGGPFAAAVLSKGITASKVDEGTLTKTKPSEQRSMADGLRDVVSADDGNADLIDMQYFFFNLVALVYVLVNLVPDLELGFPEIPDFLIGLTSAAALTYVGKKAVDRSEPAITRVVPSKASRGDEIQIQGRYLTSGDQPPPVEIGGAAVSDVRVAGNPSRDTVRLKLTVPDSAPVGEDVEVAVSPAGAAVPATATLDIIEMAIVAVQPTPVPVREGTMVEIKGNAFPTDPLTVELGEAPIRVDQWTPERIVGTIGAVPRKVEIPPDGMLPLKLIGTAGDRELRLVKPVAASRR